MCPQSKAQITFQNLTTPPDIEASTPRETRYVAEVKPRAWYDGNFSFWWLLGAVLGLWFTLYKGLGILFSLLPSATGRKMGPFFAIHLVTAALFLGICVYNVFHTPSHGGSYRAVHIVLGRMAMIAGLISFGCGAVTAFWERYNGHNGFAIGITIGGIIQVCTQLYGWYQIRRAIDYMATTPRVTAVIVQNKPRRWQFLFVVAASSRLEPLAYAVQGLYGSILVGLLPAPTALNMGPFFAIHLVTAALFLAICVFNILHTPSHGTTYCKVHIFLGRTDMMSGLISFICGAVTAWWERYTGLLGFAIGITSGGAFQV
ncbi:hypothetical protein AC1031_015961 [Aphanomyces cochlioides]|nr:hypothetical protein AC1031_015961 [Aphanomyces cochlioides]